jgi:hypothetical protein
MSATLTRRPLALFEAAAAPAGCFPQRRPADGRPTTLEERLATTWRALHEAGEADCPICHTAMRMERGSGHCTSCETTLS